MDNMKSNNQTRFVLIAWTSTLLLSKPPLVIARDPLGTDIPWIMIAWLGDRILLVLETFVVLITVFIIGIKRQDVFLVVGNLKAPVGEQDSPDLAGVN